MVIDMNKRNEKISAFLDNGMHSDELMSFSLSAEADDAKVAQRYQMVGDTLRGELSDSSFIDVSQAVREALANENIATEMGAVNTAVNNKASADEVGNKKASTGFFDWSSLFRPAAGMATAALVAVVMVFSLSEQGNDNFAPNSVAVQEINPSMNNAAVAQPASTQQGQAQFRTVANVPSTQPAHVNNKATKMSPYINQHLEFARQETLQGRMPYVRAVSFENKAK